MFSPLSIEQFASDLERFNVYLDNQPIQDEDVKHLKEYINKASNLLDTSKTKLTQLFNINLPDHPDVYLMELVFYKSKILYIQTQLQKLKETDASQLNTIVDDIYKRLEHQIKVRSEIDRPKAEVRPTDF
ncbi:hypothetical protein [uncultured Nostoc sp.]|uniref:hypothetical protein n=1 Tax=uncultured Nostoc sp. TaxID=340711 RepID=UPI0035CB1EB9